MSKLKFQAGVSENVALGLTARLKRVAEALQDGVSLWVVRTTSKDDATSPCGPKEDAETHGHGIAAHVEVRWDDVTKPDAPLSTRELADRLVTGGMTGVGERYEEFEAQRHVHVDIRGLVGSEKAGVFALVDGTRSEPRCWSHVHSRPRTWQQVRWDGGKLPHGTLREHLPERTWLSDPVTKRDDVMRALFHFTVAIASPGGANAAAIPALAEAMRAVVDRMRTETGASTHAETLAKAKGAHFPVLSWEKDASGAFAAKAAPELSEKVLAYLDEASLPRRDAMFRASCALFSWGEPAKTGARDRYGHLKSIDKVDVDPGARAFAPHSRPLPPSVVEAERLIPIPTEQHGGILAGVQFYARRK